MDVTAVEHVRDVTFSGHTVRLFERRLNLFTLQVAFYAPPKAKVGHTKELSGRRTARRGVCVNIGLARAFSKTISLDRSRNRAD